MSIPMLTTRRQTRNDGAFIPLMSDDSQDWDAPRTPPMSSPRSSAAPIRSAPMMSTGASPAPRMTSQLMSKSGANALPLVSAGRGSPVLSGNATIDPAPMMHIAFQDQPQQVANRQASMARQRDMNDINTGRIKQASAANIDPNAAQPANRIEITAQHARAMYNNLPANYSPQQRVEAFHAMGKEHGFDSHAMLDSWMQDGTLGKTQFATGEMKQIPAQPSLDKVLYREHNGQSSLADTAAGPVGQVVTMPNGKQIMVGNNGRQVGPALGNSAPPMPSMAPILSSTESGYTPAPMMSTMMSGNNAGSPTPATPPMNPALYTKEAAVHQRTNEKNRLQITGETQEAFGQAGLDRQSAVNDAIAGSSPAAIAAARGQTAENVANINAQSRVDAAQAHAGSRGVTQNIRPADRVAARKLAMNQRIVDSTTGKTRRLTGDELEGEVQRILSGPAPTTQPAPPAINGDGSPDRYDPDGGGGKLRATPKSIADKYHRAAGGNVDAMKRNLQRDGYDPDQVLTDQ